MVLQNSRLVGTIITLIVASMCFAITAFTPRQTFAQTPSETSPQAVNVGVYVSPPFVVDESDTYHGMAIDLWEIIASNLDLATHYVEFSTFRTLVDATRNGSIDVAVTNLTITSHRAELISFTQPWYDGGLRIMVPDEGRSGFQAVISGLGDAGHLRAYTWLLIVIAIATIGFTIFDRKFDPAFPRRWREGIAESLYHVTSIATAGRATRKNLFGWIGRIWQALWLVIGVGVIAYVTSSVTSVMTTVSLEKGIHSLADLPGKTVGVFSGSVAEEFTARLGIASRPYPDIDRAVTALRAGRVEAIVGDAPILEHFAHSKPEENVSVVGNTFHRDKYGFAFPHDSELTHAVTLQILQLIENNTVEELRSRYFGNAH